MKRFLEQNPRKSLIFGVYLFLMIVGWLLLGIKTQVMQFLYLFTALVFIFIYRTDCVAMLGNFIYGRGNREKAAKYLKYSVEHNTKSPAAHLHYAIYLMRKGSAREANALLDKAMGLNLRPMMLKNIQLTKGSCLWVMGDVDASIEYLERMRTMYEYVNPSVLSTLAYMYFLKDDLDKAETLSQAAIEDTPSTHAAWDNLGQIHYKRNNLPQAREAFEKALEYKAELPDSLYYLGIISQQEGDTARAAEFFNRALACEITALNTVTRPQIEAALAAIA